MRKVLVTGAEGFIGKNLRAHLQEIEDLEIFIYDIDNTEEQLIKYAKEADFIFHLAGVNRPKTTSEFDQGNHGLTAKLLAILKENKKRTPFLITSSTQALEDNPYGISKRKAEEEVFAYGKEAGASVYIYRLPNVFGKWSRPNYNSVVATFCYNIVRDLPITIHDPHTQLTLAYIDDVCREFISVLEGKVQKNGICQIPVTYQITLQELADTLYDLSANRHSLVMPSLKDPLMRALYATYLSFLPDSGFGYELDQKRDERGWLAEFIKSEDFGQIFISKTKPGITRGNHWHHTKVEKFLVIQGEAIVSFRKVNGEKRIEYKVCGEEPKVLDIPAGYTHAITNIGDTDLITLFWASEIFDLNLPDTYYLEV